MQCCISFFIMNHAMLTFFASQAELVISPFSILFLNIFLSHHSYLSFYPFLPFLPRWFARLACWFCKQEFPNLCCCPTSSQKSPMSAWLSPVLEPLQSHCHTSSQKCTELIEDNSFAFISTTTKCDIDQNITFKWVLDRNAKLNLKRTDVNLAPKI